MWKVRRAATLLTMSVFAGGIVQIQILSGRDVLLPWPRLFLWLMLVLALGAALGLSMSAAHSMYAYARERPAPSLVGTAFLIGLNIAAIALLWLVPSVF